jgi:hypothetical protein
LRRGCDAALAWRPHATASGCVRSCAALPLGELAVVPGPHNADYAAAGHLAELFLAFLQVRSGFHQLGTHPGQGTALQPRDVHLGAADPGRDFVLVQVLEEPQDDDLTF